MSRANYLIKLLTEMSTKLDKINIVETGTIRFLDQIYAEGDGWSTLHIANWLKLPHTFTSIDLNTKNCNKFLTEKGLRDKVNLIQGSSLDVLPTLGEINFAYLDSANDADLILNEFKIVEPKMVKGGIVVIDDVDPKNPELQKGLKVLRYIEGKYRYQVKDRQLTIWF